MIRTSTALLGAGVLIAGLAGPMAASAHAGDNALAFVVGAAVGQAIDNDRHHVRHVHRTHVVPVHRGYGRYHGYAYAPPWKHYQRAKWRHDYRHFQRKYDHHDRRWDRRWDKDRRDWDRDHRGGDRHDRHDRRRDGTRGDRGRH